MGKSFLVNWGRLPNMTFMISRVNLSQLPLTVHLHAIEENFEHDIDHNYVYDTTQGEYMDEKM